MPTDAEYEAAMKRVYGDKKKSGEKKPKPTKPNLRQKIRKRMDRLDEITRNGTTPDRRYS
jgi:hypothetical protein